MREVEPVHGVMRALECKPRPEFLDFKCHVHFGQGLVPYAATKRGGFGVVYMICSANSC